MRRPSFVRAAVPCAALVAQHGGHLHHVARSGRVYHAPVAARVDPQRDAGSNVRNTERDTTMRNVRRYAMVAAVAVLAACSDDESGTGPGGSPAMGSFTATMAGDISGSLSGLSAFASASSGESQGFVFAMQDSVANSTAVAALLFVKQSPERPGVGVHEVVAFDAEEAGAKFGLFGAVVDAGGGEWLCTASEGTISVTSSSPQRIRGSFNVAAECMGMGSDETQVLTLSGSFDSRVGTVPGGVD